MEYGQRRVGNANPRPGLVVVGNKKLGRKFLVLSLQRTWMKNLWWAYTTCTVMPTQKRSVAYNAYGDRKLRTLYGTIAISLVTFVSRQKYGSSQSKALVLTQRLIGSVHIKNGLKLFVSIQGNTSTYFYGMSP